MREATFHDLQIGNADAGRGHPKKPDQSPVLMPELQPQAPPPTKSASNTPRTHLIGPRPWAALSSLAYSFHAGSKRECRTGTGMRVGPSIAVMSELKRFQSIWTDYREPEDCELGRKKRTD